MTNELLTRVETCYRLAEAYFKEAFSRPRISLKLRGQKAGVAHLDENLLRFNARLYQQNRHDFLRQTVAHEVAHLIVHHRFGHSARPHGEQWQQVMNNIYQLPAERFHSYQVEQHPRTQYLYRCACPGQNFWLTGQRHSLINRGRRYFCKTCDNDLYFTGQVKKR